MTRLPLHCEKKIVAMGERVRVKERERERKSFFSEKGLILSVSYSCVLYRYIRESLNDCSASTASSSLRTRTYLEALFLLPLLLLPSFFSSSPGVRAYVRVYTPACMESGSFTSRARYLPCLNLVATAAIT